MDLSIPGCDALHMTLMDESSAALADLDRELAELQTRVELARRNPWHGGDVIAPEFARFLSSLAARPVGDDADPAGPSGSRPGRRNVWRESLEQLG